MSDRDFRTTFFAGCAFRGPLDHAAADRALRLIIDRHPLASMQIEQGTRGQLDWVQRNRQREFYTLDVNQEGLPQHFHRIDPRLENAACGWKIATKQGWDIVFQSHHAAMDGLGGLQMVSEWMIAYANELSSTGHISLRRLDVAQLKRRNHLGMLSRQFLARLHCQPLAIFGAGKFLWRQVTPILPAIERGLDSTNEKWEQLPGDYPRLESRILDQATLNHLQATVDKRTVTLHALLMRELFLTIHNWRTSKGFHQKNERLRIMIPMSIRTVADRRLPAANRATIVQMDRADRHFEDPEQMLYWINDELRFVRRCNLQNTFLIFVRGVAQFPGLMRRMAMSRKCRATSAITNLGTPFDRLKLPRENGKIRAGKLILEDFDLVVPLRPATPVGFAVAQYGGQFKISMHFDSRIVSDEHAASLMELFVQRLRSVA